MALSTVVYIKSPISSFVVPTCVLMSMPARGTRLRFASLGSTGAQVQQEALELLLLLLIISDSLHYSPLLLQLPRRFLPRLEVSSCSLFANYLSLFYYLSLPTYIRTRCVCGCIYIYTYIHIQI